MLAHRKEKAAISHIGPGWFITAAFKRSRPVDAKHYRYLTPFLAAVWHLVCPGSLASSLPCSTTAHRQRHYTGEGIDGKLAEWTNQTASDCLCRGCFIEFTHTTLVDDIRNREISDMQITDTSSVPLRQVPCSRSEALLSESCCLLVFYHHYMICHRQPYRKCYTPPHTRHDTKNSEVERGHDNDMPRHEV